MKKIMIVEDEIIIAMSYIAALKSSSFKVSKIYSTGEEAIKAFVTIDPDLILMDIKLKGKIDGIEAANQILKLKNIPIIFMTGNSDTETKKRALSLKSAAYMNKPINSGTLVNKIKEFIN
ncbi:MAG: response regulator [Spirochaetia bacterium]|jgi:DNA-binding response OmpR family regulator|nr:response regulator [Spirochaetia bacterium]